MSDNNIRRNNKNSKIRIKKQASSGSNSSKRPRRSENIVRFSRNNDVDENYMIEEEERRKKAKKIRKRKRRLVILKKLITVFLIIFLIVGSAGFLYVRNIVSDMPVLTKKVVYDNYINKEPIPLSKIPKRLREAVVAIEDQRFYEHKGIDYRSLMRSFVNNIMGGNLQGGSTIDMQLSKNLFTGNQKTLKRKIQDMYYATMLNKIMTKDEILEAYLNNIYFGKDAYGVAAGAHLYFGKDVSKLKFGEATMLAGITNNPLLYQNYEMAKKRQAVILYKMYKLEYIKKNVYKSEIYRDTPFKSEIDK